MRYFFSNFNTVSQAAFGYLLLTVQRLCYLWEVMPRQRSPVLPTTFYLECYGFERAFFTSGRFLPCTLSCWFPWGWQFNIKVSRASCWSVKHSPSPTICLNHSNPQKVYTGRFYLRARAGHLRNINLYKMFASHGI